MSGMDLAQWLGAQLDTDERIARAAPTEIGRTGIDDGVPTGLHTQWVANHHLVMQHPETDVEAIRIVTDCAAFGGRLAAVHIAEHDPARVLREIEVDRELLAEYERLLRAHTAHKAEAARMSAAGDDDPTRIAALRREADYLPAMLHVLERWAKRKAAVYADRPGYQEGWAP